jgi:hypothetical protein
MYHTIEFAVSLEADLERSPTDRLERVAFRKGTRVPAQIRPYVIESGEDPVEVADLFFADGTTVRRVPFAFFYLVD